MAQTAVQRFYRYHAYVYDSTRWMILHQRRRAVACLGLRPDSRVLDVGCGTGLHFRYLQEHLDPRRGQLTGIDFSQDMLERAARRATRRGWTNVQLEQADATQLDLGETYDGILFAYSLTMIPDWPAALERAWMHLRPGGRLVVLDFGRFDRWGPLAPVMRGWLRLNHVETLRPYTDKLRDLFNDRLEVENWLGGYCFVAAAQRSN